jgi:spore coat protein CotH
MANAMRLRRFVNPLIGITLLLSLVACQVPSTLPAADAEQTALTATDPAATLTDSHSSEAAPDFEVVFPQDKVNRIEITILPENWQSLQDNMAELFGAFGAGENNRGGANQPGGNRQPAGGQPVANGLTVADPDYIEATINFNGETWEHVGFRFKGNSSLTRAWKNGIMKMSIKLDFDQFEDEYPQTKNQRFYGFKQLSLGSNAFDDSLLREKVTADVFRAAGLAAPHTAYYAVYVDSGDGLTYFGLYTMVEVVEDTVIQTQFSDDSGNLYKPEGSGAAFVDGTFNPASFEKQTNEEAADWSDIQALFAALNDPSRLSDPAAWRAQLESVFDVDTFLHWLAVNTVMQNWDSYGQIAHNYYLYHDPASDKLVWIPWDNNEAMRTRQGQGSVNLDLANVNTRWPLINYLAADEVYYQKYVGYVADTITNVFTPEKMEETFSYYHALIQSYVIGADGEQKGYTHLASDRAFETSLAALNQHVAERVRLAQEFLNSR